MMNNGGRSLCYFALPVLLLAVCVVQPLPASAQMTSVGVDCSQINVPSLLMQDNMRAGRILIECGIVRGGSPSLAVAGKSPVPPNIRVSNGSDCNSSEDVCGSESMVAASTADGGKTIVVNYNANYDAAADYSGTSYSTDGGVTFKEIQPAPFGTAHGFNAGDPLVVFNSKSGEFFAGDLVGSCGGQGIGLWTSKNGKTWTVGACAHNGSFDDRPSMWSDNEPTSGTYGRMYVSYNDYTTTCGLGGCLFVTYSDDGASWSTPKQLNTGTFFRNVQITGSPRGAKLVGKNSTVFIASMDEGGGGDATRQNLMFRSTNGGKTWTQVILGPRFNPVGDQSCGGYFYQVNPIIRHMGWGEPAVGPDGVVHYDYAAAGTKGDHGDIFYQRSTDNGKTWSKPIKLNTDKDAPNKTQWMPSLSATSDGTVTASWYDRRKATSACNNVGDPGCNYERVGRQSKTNGASWLADVTISTGLITQPTQDDTGVVSCYAGDYDYDTALNAADGGSPGTAYITWTDGRHKISGVPVQSVDFAKVPEP
ncbi:MAG TPA: hypothetical protein VN950_09675 [Terriglobales bacterium]|nr:hypothetical protein [Terriglobales bacterium]